MTDRKREGEEKQRRHIPDQSNYFTKQISGSKLDQSINETYRWKRVLVSCSPMKDRSKGSSEVKLRSSMFVFCELVASVYLDKRLGEKQTIEVNEIDNDNTCLSKRDKRTNEGCCCCSFLLNDRSIEYEIYFDRLGRLFISTTIESLYRKTKIYD